MNKGKVIGLILCDLSLIAWGVSFLIEDSKKLGGTVPDGPSRSDDSADETPSADDDDETSEE